jgi:carbonic anhydrase
MEWIARGIEQFQRNVYPERRDLFESLANGQSPQVLFITCSDSRVDPNLITQAQPGEIFHLRNAGNIVPTYGEGGGCGEAATIEYALSALGIRNVVVCGHTDCGAMTALLHPKKVEDLPAVSGWLKHSESARRIALAHASADEASRKKMVIEQNVLAQLVHLQTHPAAAALLASGELNLFGWVYEIATGRVLAYSPESKRFEPLHCEFRAVPGLVTCVPEFAVANQAR